MSSGLRYDEGTLLKLLDSLPGPLRVAFAAACAERLFPAYHAYCLASGRTGAETTIKTILDRLWRDLVGDRMSDVELAQAIEVAGKLIPDEEGDSWIDEQAGGEDAVAAIVYALRCRKSFESQEAAWGARRAYEFADYRVTHMEEIDESLEGEERVLEHPIIQDELRNQCSDLETLSRVVDITSLNEVINELRTRAARKGL